MPHFDNTCPFYENDDDVETLPPYSHRQVSGLFELPEGWSSFRELPGPFYLPPKTFDQDECHELQASLPDGSNFQSSHMNPVESRSIPAQFEVPSKWNHPVMGYEMQQLFAPLARPTKLPNLITEQPLSALPAMTKEGQSQESSPISPYTPGQEVNDGDLYHLSSTFHNDTISSHELTSPGPSLYAGHVPISYAMHGYYRYPTHDAPVETSPTKVSVSATPTAEHFSHQFANLPNISTASFDNVLYQQSSRELVTPQHATPDPGISWYNSEDPRLGTWESDNNSRWYRQPTQKEEAEDTDERNLPLPDNNIHEHGQAANDAENDRHSVRPDASSNPEQPSTFPTEVCDLCGTEFTGR